MKEIIEMDNLNPNCKLEWMIHHKGANKQILINIISGLYIFDNQFRNKFKTLYNFYILDDRTIYRIINCFNSCDYDSFIENMIILDVAKLIYRFTVAKKFKVKNSEIKQIRLNSWGKEYFENNIKNIDFYKIKKNIEHEFEVNYEVYINLLNEFNKKELDTKKISDLNSQLLIKMVF